MENKEKVEKRVGAWSKEHPDIWWCECEAATGYVPANGDDEEHCPFCGTQRPDPVPTEEAVSATPDPGEGWYISDHERDKPKQQTDEYWCHFVAEPYWVPVAYASDTFFPRAIYRRKIQESPETSAADSVGPEKLASGITPAYLMLEIQKLRNRLQVLEAGQSLLREVEEFKAKGVKPTLGEPSEKSYEPTEQELDHAQYFLDGVKPASSEQAASRREQEVTVAGSPGDRGQEETHIQWVSDEGGTHIRVRGQVEATVESADDCVIALSDGTLIFAKERDWTFEIKARGACGLNVVIDNPYECPSWHVVLRGPIEWVVADREVDQRAYEFTIDCEPGNTNESLTSCSPQATAEPHSKKSASGSEVSKEEEVWEGDVDDVSLRGDWITIAIPPTKADALPSDGTRVFITTSDPRVKA